MKSDNKELIKRLNYARQVLEFSMKKDRDLKADVMEGAFAQNQNGLNTGRGRSGQNRGAEDYDRRTSGPREMLATAR